MSFELRHYQRASCDAVWECLKNKAGNPVVCLPTGSGKSLCIAELCRAAVQEYAGRVIVLQHRKELIQQNTEKIRALLPGLPVGIYSAGLNRSQINEDIIVAGIQSVHKRAHEFGRRHLVVIDEVHLVQKEGEGMYRTFLETLGEINLNLRLVGLTATPYRTGEGSICSPSGLFQKICYEAKLPALIEAGYLCPIRSDAAEASVDTSGLHIRAGEFITSEMEKLFDSGDHVAKACQEIVAKTCGRHSIMVFCAGVIHAQDVANYIEKLSGERVGVVTGDTSPLERSSALSDFKAQRLRWLINVSVLTTGFDAPCIDAIAVLRATASPGLFAQICGRGLRVDSSKQDCVVLDFGQNVARHGPLDSPEYGKKSARRQQGFDSSPGEPGKLCPGCGEKCAPSLKRCECGFLFPVNHEETADSKRILSAPVVYEVIGVHMNRHRKRGAGPDTPDTLRVTYKCEPLEGKGNISTVEISEWVCLEHPNGFAFRKALEWWKSRSKAPLWQEADCSIDAAIDFWKRGAVAIPRTITAIQEGRFYRIVAAEIDEIPDEWEDPPEPQEAVIDEWGQVNTLDDPPF